MSWPEGARDAAHGRKTFFSEIIPNGKVKVLADKVFNVLLFSVLGEESRKKYFLNESDPEKNYFRDNFNPSRLVYEENLYL